LEGELISSRGMGEDQRKKVLDGGIRTHLSGKEEKRAKEEKSSNFFLREKSSEGSQKVSFQ